MKKWEHLVRDLPSRQYTCSFCGNDISSNMGYITDGSRIGKNIPFPAKGLIYICHHCKCPTYFDGDFNQYPGCPYGKEVDHLPENIKKLYEEARLCYSAKAYTAAAMCCRKLLMNISVENGAKEGKHFVEYVQYLLDNNCVPKGCEKALIYIKDKGNEANHEIISQDESEARKMLDVIEIILRVNYEYPEKFKD